MSLKNGEMQVISVLGAAILSAALGGGTLWFTNAKAAAHIDLGKMTQIEASIAYKKTPKKQPQKKFKAPDPVDKPKGVSHDDKKQAHECDASHPCDDGETCDHGVCKPDKKAKKPPKPAETDPFAKFKHPTDDENTPVGPQTMPQVGDLRGSVNGNAEVSKGDPYFGALLADMHFQAPSIAKGDSSPVACIALQPDGKIRDYKFDHETHDDIQIAAEHALERLQKIRNEKPQEVPTRLLPLTHHYICFTFNVE